MNKQGQSDGTKLFQWRKQTGERYLNRFKRRTCREHRLREFNFNLIHRIVVSKKELFRLNIKSDGNCIYCGEPESIDYTFLECQFTKYFTKCSSVLTVLTKKLNYTLLFLRYYI